MQYDKYHYARFECRRPDVAAQELILCAVAHLNVSDEFGSKPGGSRRDAADCIAVAAECLMQCGRHKEAAEMLHYLTPEVKFKSRAEMLENLIDTANRFVPGWRNPERFLQPV